ncbi:MAG: hypothetical protein HY689_06640 [Chloroflexi bacterium]|nr:hypothetical protein [Chloroflexota bacterium]
MQLLDFQHYPVWLNLMVFAGAAGVVWIAGAKITTYADVLATRTGLGQAFMGLLFLAGATSLPELSSVATAGLIGNGALAVSDLLGTLVVNAAILAVADLAFGAGALTSFAPRAVLLLQGAGVLTPGCLVLAGMATGDRALLGQVGLWPALIFVGYLIFLRFLQQYDEGGGWQAVHVPEAAQETEAAAEERSRRYAHRSTRTLSLYFAGLSAVILAAGTILARSADALIGQTGLATPTVGVGLLALATSLPELSTTVSSVRLGAYSMAVSNVFGSNAFGLALLFWADVFYRQDAVFTTVTTVHIFVGAMGLLATAVYLVGIVERKNVAVLRLGIDSLVVLGIYLATLAGLFLQQP